jgi:hypothetical protein
MPYIKYRRRKEGGKEGRKVSRIPQKKMRCTAFGV